MKISTSDDAARKVAASIVAGEPVLFLVGSYVSYLESGVPPVDAFITKIWEGFEHHPDLGKLPPWLYRDPVKGELKDSNTGRVQFEVYFQLFEEYVGGSLTQWAIKSFEGHRPSPNHHFLAKLCKRYPNVSIATTNFDRLFEIASPNLDSVVFPESQSGPIPRGIYKLHGTVDDPASTVISMRRIASGLPESARQWLSDLAGNSSIVYLGWSGSDFDIYPTIRNVISNSFDFFTIRPMRSNEDQGDYENDHWRQREMCLNRPNTSVVIDYRLLLRSLAHDLNIRTPKPHKAAVFALSESPIESIPLPLARNYLLALLEYAGEGYAAAKLSRAYPPDDVRGRSLERRAFQALARFGDMSRRGAGSYIGAVVSGFGPFERLNAMSDWSTARCNQRYIWHFFGSWRASHLARRLAPRTPFEYDVQTRAMQHWGVGVEIMADVLTRAHMPGASAVRDIAERLFSETSAISTKCGDMYRKLTCDLEVLRSQAYRKQKRSPQYIDSLVYACRELSQLGRSHDLTIYVERGLAEARSMRHDSMSLFADLFVDSLLVLGLRTGGAMVVAKGTRAFKGFEPSIDPTLMRDCSDWAKRQGQFGLWGPITIVNRGQLELETLRQSAMGLAARIEVAKQELIDHLCAV